MYEGATIRSNFESTLHSDAFDEYPYSRHSVATASGPASGFGTSPAAGFVKAFFTCRSSSSFCSFAKSRPNSATVGFSFCRTGVVPVRVLEDLDPVYLVARFLPKGPDSSGGRRGFREELEVMQSAKPKGG